MREKLTDIRNQLKQAFPGANVQVQPSRHEGINMKVVWASFPEDLTERHIMVENALKKLNMSLDDEQFRFVELLTPEEDALFGTPLADLEPEQLPFWANVLVNNTNEPSIEYRTDSEIEVPQVITFYSFKGGVGRTTALTATARLLAQRGRRVIAVDMDLEAPSLPEMFGVKLSTARQKSGLLELFHRLEEQESGIDVRNYLVEVSENLYLLPAGELNVEYLERLQGIDFHRYYRLAENPVVMLLDRLQQLEPKPDFILIDARTGLTDISAPLLFHLSDMSVVVFHPHPQSKQGLDLLVRGILGAKNRRNLTSELRFVISMVPPSDSETKQIRNRGLEWVRGYVDEISKLRRETNKPPLDLEAEDIVLSVSYSEQMAFSSSMNDDKLFHPYEVIADWIDSLVEASDAREPIFNDPGFHEAKNELLHHLQIQTGVAEDQSNLPDVYVKTSSYRKAIDPMTTLILGRKGTGKSALFRMLNELYKDQSIIVRHSRPDTDHAFHLTIDELRYLEERLPERNWSLYWGTFVLLKLCQAKPECIQLIDESNIREFLNDVLEHRSRLRLIKGLETLLGNEPLLSSKIYESFRTIHERLNKPLVFLWDGLDRDFGIEAEQRKRRDRVLIGLFDFWNMLQSMPNYQFKIFLRKDIWDNLIFDNKSHFYGRTLTLEWTDMHEYYKTLLKQIYQGAIKPFIEEKYKNVFHDRILPAEVEYWTEDQVIFGFNLLVGERMKGGKTAYTKNWVWSRLSDGKGNRSPRFLFQLFDQAIRLEREEHLKNPYDRSLLRPRMLIEGFQEVSREAVSSLLEEYEELRPLQEFLKNKIAPFEYSRDSISEDLFITAVEAGVIVVYETNRNGEPVRLTVPDLYLKGLEMSRRGQA